MVISADMHHTHSVVQHHHLTNGCSVVLPQISDAVYRLVQSQAKAQYEAIVQSCEAGSPPLEASIRTDMDQIITSKEHVTGKIRGTVDSLLKVCYNSLTCPVKGSLTLQVTFECLFLFS